MREIGLIHILILHQAPFPGKPLGKGDSFQAGPQSPQGIGARKNADTPVMLGHLQHKIHLGAGDIDFWDKARLNAAICNLA